ncbi:hypothetical protein T492DRAFT_1131280 [Pavlovales sp. CCMP2436]|nr:hypothetical protein T492DRAFT_1131280 [Pavlovales sp. CCMP2436]
MRLSFLLVVILGSTQALSPVGVLRARRPHVRSPSSDQDFLPKLSTAVVRRDTPARSSPTARANNPLQTARANNPLQPAPFLLGTLSTAAIGIGAKALHSWFSNERLFEAAACKAKREQEDAELGTLVDRPVKTIVFAIGPRGAGKTTAIVRALERIDGALLIKLTGAHDRDTSVYSSIFGPSYRCVANWKPTVILELEISAEPATVRVAVQALKGLVWDRGVCHSFIVLSDAHSFYSLTSDEARHTYTWVGDFSPAEADMYLDELEVLTATDERTLRDDVYANATTRAIELMKLSFQLKSTNGPAHDVVRGFIQKAQQKARVRVRNLILVAKKDAAVLCNGTRGLHFMRLMKAMLKAGGSLPVEDASVYMCSDADIADVLKKLGHHAVMINVVNYMFFLNTPADRVAAEHVTLLGECDRYADDDLA